MTGLFVNKLTVDRDDAFSPVSKHVNILKYTGDELAQRNVRKIVEIVYRNFNHINKNPELKHTRREIARILTSPRSITIFGIIDGQIISYIIAELNTLDDLRQLMHISYLYTSPVYRSKGIATHMLNSIQEYTLDADIHTLSLTFDTYNKKLEKFYLNHGFKYDPSLRSHQRYDMMIKKF